MLFSVVLEDVVRDTRLPAHHFGATMVVFNREQHNRGKSTTTLHMHIAETVLVVKHFSIKQYDIVGISSNGERVLW